jgi:hypothetical protein
MLVDPTGGLGVAGTIREAARVTGTSFEYLLATAKVESNLNPKAAAPTSSATGLFQFIEQTWLGTLKDAGAALGYGHYAGSIVQTADGYQVPDAKMRREIMNLRSDPGANAAMAGAYTTRNAAVLEQQIGRRPTDGELYIAHFLGANGAAKLISLTTREPEASAAAWFPTAAKANRSIFYDRRGHARSALGVYQELNRRYEAGRSHPAIRTAMASVVQRPPAPIPVSAPAPARAPDTAGMVAAYAPAHSDVPPAKAASPAEAPRPVSDVRPVPTARAAQEARPMFHALFQTGDRPAPVAAAVSELWTVRPVSGAGRDTGQTDPAQIRALFGVKA